MEAEEVCAAEPWCKMKGRGTNSRRSKDSPSAQIRLALSCCHGERRPAAPRGAAQLCCSPPGRVVGTSAAARKMGLLVGALRAPCTVHRAVSPSSSSTGDAGEHKVTSSLLVALIRVTSSGGKVDGRSRG